MDTGEALRIARESLGLSQIEVSRAIGVKRSTYEAYENSLLTPGLEIMEVIADLLGLDLVGTSEEPLNNTVIRISQPTAEYKTNIKEDKDDLSPDERMVLKYIEALDTQTRTKFLNDIREKYIDIVVEGMNKKEK